MIFLSNVPFFFHGLSRKFFSIVSSFSGKFILRAVALIVASRSISSFFFFFSFEINLSSASLISFRVLFFYPSLFLELEEERKKVEEESRAG